LANDSPPIEGDARRLQQVVLNLLSNAIKFTPNGGIVEITMETGEEDVVLTVRDSGQGISPEALPRIFDRFHQTTEDDTDGGTASTYPAEPSFSATSAPIFRGTVSFLLAAPVDRCGFPASDAAAAISLTKPTQPYRRRSNAWRRSRD
jgi:hypothetical protein